jgi:hypothetical protein
MATVASGPKVGHLRLADGGSITWRHLEDSPVAATSAQNVLIMEEYRPSSNANVPAGHDFDHASSDESCWCHVEDIHASLLADFAFTSHSAPLTPRACSSQADSQTPSGAAPANRRHIRQTSSDSPHIPIIRISMAGSEFVPSATRALEQESAGSSPALRLARASIGDAVAEEEEEDTVGGGA